MNTHDLERTLERHYRQTDIIPDHGAKQKVLHAIAQTTIPQTSYPGMPYHRFVMGQVRFIGKEVWILQAALILALFLFYGGEDPGAASAPIVSAIGALTVTIGLPEFFRSRNSNVAELEYACHFDCKHAIIARLIILGLSDIVILTCMIIAVPALVELDPFAVFLFACVPYFATCTSCLWVVNHVRHAVSSQLCLFCGIIIALAALFAWQAAPQIYFATSIGVWAMLFCITAITTTIQVKHYLTRIGAGLDHLPHVTTF